MIDEHFEAFIVDPDKLISLDAVHTAMQLTAKGNDIKVIKELDENIPKYGRVSVSGQKIKFIRPDMVALALEMGADFDVSVSDKETEVGFTFKDIARKVK